MSTDTAETPILESHETEPAHAAHSTALAQVAQHEKQLMAQLETARAEAEAMIAKARVDARGIADAAADALAAELAKTRALAEAEREKVRAAVVEEAEGKARAECGRAMLRLDQAAERIAALVLPGGGGAGQ
jgi:F0F1-type ATP synthase membrane subunit b/b'